MTKNEIRRIKKGLTLIEMLLSELASEDSLDPVFQHRDSFHHIFYNGDRLDELFLFLFPVETLEIISKTLSAIKMANGTSGDELTNHRGISIRKDKLTSNLQMIKSYLTQAIIAHSFNIFYSWQSDLNNTTNRNFIENALEKAIADVSKELKLPLQLDKDTTDKTGSPNIANTILEKIDDCFIFIADISITVTSGVTGKGYPNSNVLFELGYAQGVLGEENIIMVFNDAFGKIEDLPFDLRGKRIMKYSCSNELAGESKKTMKNELAKQLRGAIQSRCKTEFK
jgi:hypothetical protein